MPDHRQQPHVQADRTFPDRELLGAVCGPCLADTVMMRFAAVKDQRVVALAKDMSAAADHIVKLRDHARWNNRDATELRDLPKNRRALIGTANHGLCRSAAADRVPTRSPPTTFHSRGPVAVKEGRTRTKEASIFGAAVGCAGSNWLTNRASRDPSRV
jgi:hypothetical protein